MVQQRAGKGFSGGFPGGGGGGGSIKSIVALVFLGAGGLAVSNSLFNGTQAPFQLREWYSRMANAK